MQRRAGLFGQKQEIFHIADDVFALAGDFDFIAAAVCQGIFECPIRVKGLALLIKYKRLQIDAQLNIAAVRLELPHDQFQQRGLPAAVRSDNAQPVTAINFQG